jgi:hypothetical protein
MWECAVVTLVCLWTSVFRLGLFGLFTLRVLPKPVTNRRRPDAPLFLHTVHVVDVCLRSQSVALTLLIMVATLPGHLTVLSIV